jgi:predicted house-cleaning noncanonical NTP pyrophosphatase (MazG superfamily)
LSAIFGQAAEVVACRIILKARLIDLDYTLLYYPPGEEATFMVRKEYNKLVRDRIPDILTSQQVKFGVEPMTQTEYCQALRQKLIEEAQEAAKAGEDTLVTELADLWEVIDATLVAYGIQRNQVLACQMQRRMERGGCSQKLRLLWTET